jgi:RNA polymerase sigma-70 factor (ECF subfamily)
MSNPDCHHHDHRRCREIFARLSEYVDGELDEATQAQIREHLHECLQCNVCLQTLRRTIELCHHMRSRRLPPELSSKLAEALDRLRT